MFRSHFRSGTKFIGDGSDSVLKVNRFGSETVGYWFLPSYIFFSEREPPIVSVHCCCRHFNSTRNTRRRHRQSLRLKRELRGTPVGQILDWLNGSEVKFSWSNFYSLLKLLYWSYFVATIVCWLETTGINWLFPKNWKEWLVQARKGHVGFNIRRQVSKSTVCPRGPI